MQKEDRRENFRLTLGFEINDIYQSKENSIAEKIKKIFPNEIINGQYKVNKYFIDLVFPVHKLEIEIDKNGHMDRSKAEEQKRSKIIKAD